ncbi:unnamed protein product [Blepharisma stoltei]|uniref:Tetratricopeptide repeat protein n=1 Tax=Blepharisma stoltei TaxID=1481888 RepID=A0AAU9J6I4_9CILI|nr:unnamed protein product [Blepharisma stoltei]
MLVYINTISSKNALLYIKMGKCVSKPKKSRKSLPQPKNEEEKFISNPKKSVSPVSSCSDLKLSRHKRNIENLETQEDQSSVHKSISSSSFPFSSFEMSSGLQENPSIQISHLKTGSKISMDFNQLSKVSTEHKMLKKIAKRLNELVRAYHRERNYFPSIELLQLQSEIYLHLGMYREYNTSVGDLILAVVIDGENAIGSKLPVLIEPIDERTKLLVSAWKFFIGNEREIEEENLRNIGVFDIADLIEMAEKLDTACIKTVELPEALINIGHIFRIWLGSPEEALNFYEEAMMVEPENACINFYLGLTYKALNDWKSAISQYQLGINKNPMYCDCYFNLGNIYLEEENNLKLAEQNYLIALDLCHSLNNCLVTPDKINSMLEKLYMLNHISISEESEKS